MESIFLKKSLIENKTLTDEGLLVYIALRYEYYYKTKRLKTKWIHYDDLVYNLTGLDSCNKKYIQKMKDGIENLAELRELEIIQSTKDKIKITFLDSYYFNSKKESEDISSYIIIYDYEITKIVNSNLKQKDKMLRYFICKIGTIYHSSEEIIYHENQVMFANNVGIMSIKYCADLSNVSTSSAIRYDKWLEENELLYILRSDSAIVDDCSQEIISGFTNCYSRPEHKDALENFFNLRQNRSNIGIRKLSQDVNEKRSISVIRTNYKKGKSTSTESLKRIAKDIEDNIHNCNQRIKTIKNKTKLDSADNEEIIFNNYTIKEEESLQSNVLYDLWIRDEIEIKCMNDVI